MGNVMLKLKAPLARFILVAGAFLVFIPGSEAQFDFDTNCRLAYRAALSLRFSEADSLINLEKQEVPENLIPLYLENFVDFLTLVIGEERADYSRLKEKMRDRVKKLEAGRRDSPYYNYCLGEVHLQWALARLKFGDYTAAIFDLHSAHEKLSENEKKYPSFLINKIGIGVIHVMVSLVPDRYKWVTSIVGFDGSMESGISEIRQVAGYSGPDEITTLYKTQAAFFLAFCTLNLQGNKNDALALLPLLRGFSPGGLKPGSPLLIYARAIILMRNGLNDEALKVLQERQSLSPSYPFCFLDYLEGMSRLNKLDQAASVCFERFIAGFRGQNYLKSACQKLAWIALLKGDSAGYRRMTALVLLKGTSVVDEDKQAEYEAGSGVAPGIFLLRARLLFDGGYYKMALGELLNNSVSNIIKSKRDLVEYTYRLGRIYHEEGNVSRAVENYRQTIRRGKTEPFYFAAGAALQLGLLYENKGAYNEANRAYRLCLSIDPAEYKTSLHQKAKAGLARLKTLQVKT